MTESGGTSSFTVSLAPEPLQPVTINLSTSDDDEVSLSASTLSFDASDWSSPKAVTLTGVDDVVDALRTLAWMRRLRREKDDREQRANRP